MRGQNHRQGARRSAMRGREGKAAPSSRQALLTTAKADFGCRRGRRRSSSSGKWIAQSAASFFRETVEAPCAARLLEKSDSQTSAIRADRPLRMGDRLERGARLVFSSTLTAAPSPRRSAEVEELRPWSQKNSPQSSQKTQEADVTASAIFELERMVDSLL